jgi:DNA-binding CsgD family transcriptional regulator
MLDIGCAAGDVTATLERVLPWRSVHERSAALSADERSQEVVALSEVWDRLAWGSLEIVDDFVTMDRCYLIVRAREDHAMKKLERRGLMVLKRVLIEGCQKIVAMDLGIAASTAASLGRTGLMAMGLRCRVHNTPYIVAVAAHASHERASAWARVSRLTSEGPRVQVLSVPRPESRVHHLLSQAVLEVTGSLLEGKTRSVIAQARNRSERTVANQLSIAFRQLNASSRLDLMRVLARSPEREAVQPS